MLRFFKWVGLLFTLTHSQFTTASVPLTLQQDFSSRSLVSELGYLEDANNQLTPDRVIQAYEEGSFIFPRKESLNFGYTHSTYWLWASISVSSEQTSETPFIIEYEYAPIDLVSLYLISEGTIVSEFRDGDQELNSTASRRLPKPTFPVLLKPNQEYNFLFRISGEGSLQAPIKIWTEEAFLKMATKELLFWGAFFGILACMLVYNSFIYFTVKDSSYLLYICYISCFIIFEAGIGGHLSLLLREEVVAVATRHILLPALLLLASISFFTRSFLQLFKHTTSVSIILYFVGCVGLLLALVSPYLNYQVNSYITSLYLLAVSFTCTLVALMGAVRGWAFSTVYLVAWSPFLASLIIEIARNFNFLPVNFFTQHVLQIGSLVQIVLLSLALAERIKLAEHEREQALQTKASIEHSLRLKEKELTDSALHDSITGLPNKAVIANFINQHAQLDNTPFAFIMIHSRGHADVANTLGHMRAEALICEACNRLKPVVDLDIDIIDLNFSKNRIEKIAAIENSNFIVLLKRDKYNDNIPRLCKVLKENLDAPFAVAGLDIDFRSTIGVSLFPEHGVQLNDLLQKANVALHENIGDIKPYSIYSKDFDQFTERRLTMMVELKNALRTGGLELHYQPQINLKTSEISGCEALLRWNHNDLGFLSPGEFIPIAEQTGLIHELSAWVASETVKLLHHTENTYPDLKFSINLSAKDVCEDEIAVHLRNLQHQYPFTSARLTLEVTESAVANNIQNLILTLTNLQAMGFRTSLDDFGTGYSSLYYLKQLPVNELKIDRSFVVDLAKKKDDFIIPTVISMAKRLKIDVVAEGVESFEVMRSLASIGCDTAQGFYYSKPLPRVDFFNWVESYQTKLQETIQS